MMQRWEPPIPLDNPDLPAFPTDAFPPWLECYLRSCARSIQVAPDLVAMLVLGTLATAAQGRYRVRIKPGYSEPLNLYLACALPPGCRKSAAFALTTFPLADHEQEEAAGVHAALKRQQAERRVLKQAIQNAEGKAARALDDDERRQWMQRAHQLADQLEWSEATVAPRLIADDVTPEKLVSLLHAHGRIGVLSSEAGVFSKMAAQKTMDVYLKAWAGETIAVDRQTRGSLYLRNPLLTIAIAIQPSVLSDLGGKAAMHGRGLIGRFLYVLPENLMGRRDPDPPSVPPQERAHYSTYIRRLLNAKPNDEPVTLSSEALTAWVDFVSRLEPRLRADGDLGTITEWAGKLAGHVARVAGLLHVATHVEAAPVVPLSRETVAASIAIGEYLIEHAKATFQLMHLDDRVADAQRVLRWIRASDRPTFSLRDAYQALKGNRRLRTMAKLRSAIDLLAEHHYIRPIPALNHRRPGRRPSPIYEASPFVHRTGGEAPCASHPRPALAAVASGGDACAM
jgi:replicative DNA helicase